MKEKARLVIPVWGTGYVQKLLTITIPALLAPGNLPSLVEDFDVEVVLVTSSYLIAAIRQDAAFRKLESLCPVELRSVDDILTLSADEYGVVLSYALFRGFTDLGPRMTDTWLLFLNADFILADGSYRTLARLMKEGRRVIHSPSFRATIEDVTPVLESYVDPATAALVISPRDMVALSFRHKHLTVKGRTVNQQLCHQWRMDQFYWFVDDQTMIGYQWPIALVAIKPELEVTEPTLMWDYAFVPDAAPTLPRYVISDSDDFFMLEMQNRLSGGEMIRFGAITPEEIAADLSLWTTEDQRRCGQQLLIFHSGELPPTLPGIIAISRIYMADIYRQLMPASPHAAHPLFLPWFEEAKTRLGLAMKLASLPPTGSFREEYRSLDETSAILPSSRHKIGRQDGASLTGIPFLPRDFHSTLNIGFRINCYCREDNEAVAALFSNESRRPLFIASTPAPAGTRICLEGSFNLLVEGKTRVGIELRVGPAHPGTLYINGPDQTPPSDEISFLSIVDLGPLQKPKVGLDRVMDRCLLPTESLHQQCESAVADEPVGDFAAITRKSGTSIARCRFIPHNAHSVLRVRAAITASKPSVPFVAALFQDNGDTPLIVNASNNNTTVELAYDVLARTIAPLSFELRVAPCETSAITVEGGETKRSFISIVDMGDVELSNTTSHSGDVPSRSFVRRFFDPAVRLLLGGLFSLIPGLCMARPNWLCWRGPGLSGVVPRILWVAGTEVRFFAWTSDSLPLSVFDGDMPPAGMLYGAFDACVCDLTLAEAIDFRSLYDRIRPYVRDGGTILARLAAAEVNVDDAAIFDRMLPDIDESRSYYFGKDRVGRYIAALWDVACDAHRWPIGSIVRAIGSRLLDFPRTWLAGLRSKRRDPALYELKWMRMYLEFTVRRRVRIDPGEVGGRA